LKDARTAPLVLINAVGLSPRLLEHAPRMKELARQGWVRSLREVFPAVTSTAQATILTGRTPQEHGIVANGWLFRDTKEVRFWQQSNALIQAPTIYDVLRQDLAARGQSFSAAKLFWWFNQGAGVDISITPKPHYGCDGNKVFGIASSPTEIAVDVERSLGPFPFATFWGPGAGAGCSAWISRSAAWTLERFHPNLTLVYVPHLDYDPQRFGPAASRMARHVRELDDAVAPLLEAARQQGARVWIISEYTHVDVDKPVYLQRILRHEGYLDVRPGPFGEMLDTFSSRAIAVCDHQWAHIYVRQSADIPAIVDRLRAVAEIDRIYVGAARAEVGLDHSRSGEIVVAAKRNAWFAYPYWLEDTLAPDFASTVDIHRKPGFDPCEMFFDPRIRFPKWRVIRRLMAKKLGFRMRMDVIPLDASIVRGSHGLAAMSSEDRPLLIGDGPPPGVDLAMTDVFDLIRSALTD
jgi:predicted AlkP superfamily pyrophosphatase or phosphodiesterase